MTARRSLSDVSGSDDDDDDEFLDTAFDAFDDEHDFIRTSFFAASTNERDDRETDPSALRARPRPRPSGTRSNVARMLQAFDASFATETDVAQSLGTLLEQLQTVGGSRPLSTSTSSSSMLHGMFP